MNIRFMSYRLFLRHAELVSASHIVHNLNYINETLNRVQGDVRIMIHYGHSIKI